MQGVGLRGLALACAALATWLAGCGVSDGNVYTLYRSSVLDAKQRLHVATFDAAESEEYNQENCGIVLAQMQKRADVVVRYWCEKGRFRK